MAASKIQGAVIYTLTINVISCFSLPVWALHQTKQATNTTDTLQIHLSPFPISGNVILGFYKLFVRIIIVKKK